MSKNWWILLFVSLGVMVPFIFPYVSLDPSNSRIEITTGKLQFPLLVAHIGFACVALLCGFAQFVDALRVSRPSIHRTIGRIYVSSVFISGLLVFGVIAYIEDFSKATSFIVLALLWLFTTWKGFRSAMKQEFDDHRLWMIRSFGVTLVAVSGRIVVPLLLLTYVLLNGFTLPGGREGMVEEVLKVNIWAGMIIEILVVEWIILKKITVKRKKAS